MSKHNLFAQRFTIQLQGSSRPTRKRPSTIPVQAFLLLTILAATSHAQFGERDPFTEPRAGFDQFGLVLAEAPGGVVVQAIRRGSPAQGRLEVFDVIRRVDDINVRDEFDFDRLTRLARGDISLLVWRSRLRRDEIVILPQTDGAGNGPPSESVLGIRYDFTPDNGITIRQVIPGSPAAAAGLRRGLNLVEINGTVIDSSDLLEDMIARGGRLQIRLYDRARMQWRNANVDLPVETTGGLFEQRLGVTLADIDRSVVFSSIERDSPAARAGLRNGDVLLEINGQRIRNVEDVRRVGPLNARVVRLAIRTAQPGGTYGPRVERLVRLD